MSPHPLNTSALAIALMTLASILASCDSDSTQAASPPEPDGGNGDTGSDAVDLPDTSADTSADAGSDAPVDLDSGPEASLPKCASGSSSALAFAPTEAPFSVTYAEWGQRWYQWAMALPKTGHPNSGGPCDQGQSDPAWFLGTARLGSETRTCTVPANVGLLVSVGVVSLNETADLPEDNCSWGQCPASESDYLDMCKEFLASTVENFCLEVDGVAVADLDQYNFQSGVFRVALNKTDPLYPAANAGPYGPVNCDGGTNDCAEGSDRHFYRCGYWAMLKPLPPGQHSIRFFNVSPPDPEDPTKQDSREVTYQLTVQ